MVRACNELSCDGATCRTFTESGATCVADIYANESDSCLRVAFETLGCRSNAADTVSLQALLVQRGMLPVLGSEMADVYLVNTCTVTDTAEREVFKILRRIKNCAPHARVVVTGCMASVSREKLIESQLVDVVVSSRIFGEVVDAVCDVAKSFRKDYGCNLNNGARRDFNILDGMVAPGELIGEVKQKARFHLRVQDGCNNACTYCIVPKARGHARSKSVALVIDEIMRLEEVGYKEVVICGTSLGFFGCDTKETLFKLLHAISKKITRARVRLSSLNPEDVNNEVINIIADSSVFCEHFHICVQSFSESILKRMYRRYTLGDLCRVIENICIKIPHCGLGADIIAGFPGETSEDVNNAQSLFQEYPFTYLHVFPYSERANTLSEGFEPKIPSHVRLERARSWRELGQICKARFYGSFVGKNLELVVETLIGDGVYTGTSREFVSAYIDTKCASCTHNSEINSAVMDCGHIVNMRGVSFDSERSRIIC